MTDRNAWVLLAVIGWMGAACSGKNETSGDDDAEMSGSGAKGGSAGTGATSGGDAGSSTGGNGGSTGGSSAAGGASGGSAGSTGGDGTTGGSGGTMDGSGGTTGGSGGTTGGSANGGSAGSAGSDGQVDCTGTFGTPELLFSAPPGETPQSLSITGDDLELYYEVESESAGPRLEVRKRSRRTDAFGPPTVLPAELMELCTGPTGPSLDVSDDGLRLYLTCVDTTGEVIVPGPLRLAERASRSAGFALLRPTAIGQGGVSISVSADELTAFWSDYADRSAPKPVTATRGSLDAAFGSPSGPAGAANDTLRHPEISSDLRNLFGALDAGTGFSRLVMYVRPSPSVAFGAPGTQGLPTPPAITDDPGTPEVEGVEDLSPTLSADCRSLYFLRYTHGPTRTFDVYAARR